MTLSVEKFNNYVTQLCVVCGLLSSAFSISSPSTSVASTNFSSPAPAVFIHTDSLLCPQPHTNRQQPAIRGRARAADLHFKEAEQRSPAWRHGQHCHCGTQVIILHTAVVSLHTLDMLSLNCSSSSVE